jgi:hypothetical protein
MEDHEDHDALVLPDTPGNSDTGIAQKLPTPLQFLYGLNGMIEAFPSLALIAMVNDRIEIPVSFLPAYFAVSFLPYSLKPLYAIAANVAKNRKKLLLIVLYVCSGVFFQITAFLERGQIITCFFVAFFRSVFISAAEFMIGLGLLLSASASVSSTVTLMPGRIIDADNSLYRHRLHEKLLSCFQSEAATCRNIGSFFSQLLSFALIMISRLLENRKGAEEKDEALHQLSDGLITVFCLLSSCFPFAAAFVVVKYNIFGTSGNEVDENHNSCQRRDPQNVGIFNLIKYDLIGLLTFQLLLLSIGVRSIIVENTSNQTFLIISFTLGISLILCLILSRSNQVPLPSNHYSSATNTPTEYGCSEQKRLKSMVQHLIYLKKVGLYLVLRHAVPSSDVMLSSYIYTIFRYKPLLLQSMSIFGSAVATLSTWTYNKRVAEKFSSVDGIKRVIMFATTACSIWGVLTIPLIQSLRSLMKNEIFAGGTMLLGTFTVIRLVGGFLNEISFMPSIVIATTTVIHEDAIHGNDGDYEYDDDDEFEDEPCPNSNGVGSMEQNINFPETKTIDSGIQYGFLVACIDFGDQMSTFISVPLVVFFGVTRENGWNNLEWFIFTCSILGMLSLVFLRLLPL